MAEMTMPGAGGRELPGAVPDDSAACLCASIDSYYREADFDYRMIWKSHRNKARHFGFHDAGAFDHDRALERANGYLAERAGISAATRVLDCGCGLGGTSLWLARERGAQVTGLDILPAHIESARTSAPASSPKTSMSCRPPGIAA